MMLLLCFHAYYYFPTFIGKPMLQFLKETTFGNSVPKGDSEEDDLSSEHDEQREEQNVGGSERRVVYTGQRYAVEKNAPPSQYSYARTSVKYTEHILRKHNAWMTRCFTVDVYIIMCGGVLCMHVCECMCAV